MLYELYVENFALIQKMRLPLQGGMTALTGETGAGKSLVIDAMSLLLGSRGGDNLIRGGDERCLVEGLFLPPFPPAAAELLAASGGEEGDSLILSRELVRGGRSVARLNGRPVPVARLRELGRLLVNIHGQHEYTSLLEETRQLALLDSFGGAALSRAAEDTAIAYQQLTAARSALEEFENACADREQRMDMLRFALDEIGKLDPQPGEDKSLQEEANRLAHGEKLYAAAGSALAVLREAVDKLNDAYGELRPGAQVDPEANALAERLHSAYFDADDIASELSAYQGRVDLDGYRLDQVEGRISELNRLKKKYGGTIEAMLELYQSHQAEYTRLEDISVSGAALRAALEAAEGEYGARAARLTACREQAAQELGQAVTVELRTMMMPQAEFTVELPPHGPSAAGNERALFVIRTNVGEAALPVSQIASGGELSRILLGLKVILSQLDAVPVLVFDEIDTGMSGRALVAVAERLVKVSGQAQTLAVSHSAVMAAAADHHIYIEKHEEQGRTVISAHELEQEQRIGELARMIAGDKAGDTTRRQAEDLLARLGRQAG